MVQLKEHTLGGHLSRLVDNLGVPLGELEEITALVAANRHAATFILRLVDGRIIKGRRVNRQNGAAAIAELCSCLRNLPLSPIIAHLGDSMLEEWIEGQPLCELPEAEICQSDCGALLGAIHSVTPPPQRMAELRTRNVLIAALESDLRGLANADVIVPMMARELLAAAGRNMPPSDFIPRIAHMDFCAENLVLSPANQLFLIDNATIRIGTAEEDLARVWYRWSMRRQSWQRFLEGYHRFRKPDEFLNHFPFWASIVIAHAANRLLKQGAQRLHRSLQLLRQLARMARRRQRLPPNLREISYPG